MKKRTIAGLLSITGGLVILSIWVFFLFYGQLGQGLSLESIIDHIISMLSAGDGLEFFLYSILCVLGCFISGALFISGKLPKLGITIVVANSVAVSLMFAWFVAAVVVSPLFLSKWVLNNA